MINSDKSIYLQETEVKPNRYAMLVLLVTILGMTLCWIVTELGIFRVGIWQMRIGAAIPVVSVAIPLLARVKNPDVISNPVLKYFIISISILVALSVNILLNFHSTLMLLFPTFLAMLYRSKRVGVLAALGSIFCTIVSPLLGYVLGTWDIPLLQELILIGTGQEVVLSSVYAPVSLLPVLKILLYLVFPRLIIVGSCSMLLFYVIRLGVDHVNNQILLNRMSHRDTLTGLYNQNYFKELLNSSFPDEEVGIIFFDVNGLKALNDSRGHELGDLLLQRCAQSLLDVSGDTVHPFRIGGDEFLLLLEHAGEEDIARKLEEWEEALARINEENRLNPARYLNISCSMASGSIAGRLSGLEKLVRLADERMYRAKSRMKSGDSAIIK